MTMEGLEQEVVDNGTHLFKMLQKRRPLIGQARWRHDRVPEHFHCDGASEGRGGLPWLHCIPALLEQLLQLSHLLLLCF